MKKLSAVVLGAALLTAVVYTGCKKDSTTPATNTTTTTPDNDYYAAQDEANATFVTNDSKNISDGAAKGQLTERVLGGAICGTIRWDSTGVTDTIDVHFTGTCQSLDGRYRKGDIIVYWTKGKGYFDSASSVTQTWKNYSVSNPATLTTIAVTGSTNFTNTGKDTCGDHSWKYSSNINLTYSGGTTGTSSWSATRTSVLAKYLGIYYYYVSGSASGTDKNGTNYTLTITSPLIYTAYWVNLALSNPTCGCIEAGSETLTRTGKPYPLGLTYTSGQGNCSYTANATINGITFPITVL